MPWQGKKNKASLNKALSAKFRNKLKFSKNIYFKKNTESKIISVIEKTNLRLLNKEKFIEKIRIVYFGASNYSLYFLKNLKKQNIDIAGVCSIQINKGFLTDCIDLSNYAKNQIITKRWTSNNSKQIINWIKKN